MLRSQPSKNSWIGVWKFQFCMTEWLRMLQKMFVASCPLPIWNISQSVTFEVIWKPSQGKSESSRKLSVFTQLFKTALTIRIGLLKVRKVSFANRIILLTGKKIADSSRSCQAELALRWCCSSVLTVCYILVYHSWVEENIICQVTHYNM